MKLPNLLIACSLLLAPSLNAQSPLGGAPAQWPGVKLEVWKIARIAPDHLLVAVRLRGESTLKAPVLIGTTKITEAKPAGGKPSEWDSREQIVEFKPFSLLPAKLTDQTTGISYPGDNQLPPQPNWGESEIATDIRKNTWIQLAVRFKAPPPLPPDSFGKPQPQKITFLFPGAAPIKDIVLPPVDATTK